MSELKVERRGEVTVMILNRPERHNSLTLSLAAEMKSAWMSSTPTTAKKS